MLSSIAAGSSAPVGPPARPSGNQPASLRDLVGDPRHVADDHVGPLAAHGVEQVPDPELHLGPADPRRLGVLLRDLDRRPRRGRIPITRRAPSRAATNDSTPLPQPTSITVSPGSISSASAIVRLVCVGANTPGFQRDGERTRAALPLQHGFGRLVAHPCTWWRLRLGAVNRRGRTHTCGGTNTASSPGVTSPVSTAGRERVGGVRDADRLAPRGGPRGTHGSVPMLAGATGSRRGRCPGAGGRSRRPAATGP